MEKPSYTSRRSLLNLIMGGAMGLGLGGIRPAAAEMTAPPEGLSPPESIDIAQIIDGNTLLLTNGDRLRLAGIEAPLRGLTPGDADMASLADGATALLAVMLGTSPMMRTDALKRDRYGRRLGQVFGASGLWVQAELVSRAAVRVHGDGSNRLGLRTLLPLEAAARDAKQGIWRHPTFAVRAADDPKLARFAGSFQIIEGRVAAAAVVGGTGFINFGADRHADLTLVLKNADKNPGLDLGGPVMMPLESLTSRLIRCRGWLDFYDGPRIDVSYPEQIELLET